MNVWGPFDLVRMGRAGVEVNFILCGACGKHDRWRIGTISNTGQPAVFCGCGLGKIVEVRLEG